MTELPTDIKNYLTTLDWSDVVSTEKAKALHMAIDAVDLDDVPILSADRHIPRKQQAALARKLFKRLGLAGISVTAPNYSMAHSVDVRLPMRRDYLPDYGTFDDRINDPARKANVAASAKIKQILSKAFPKHDDRSEYGTDYYDFCWSIG